MKYFESIAEIVPWIRQSGADLLNRKGAEALAELEALAARDADVRTLDDYVAGLEVLHGWTLSTYNAGVWGVVFTNSKWEELPRVPCLEGSTPDEARAKAAAWVREQGKP
jgi:hypothetical protein